MTKNKYKLRKYRNKLWCCDDVLKREIYVRKIVRYMGRGGDGDRDRDGDGNGNRDRDNESNTKLEQINKKFEQGIEVTGANLKKVEQGTTVGLVKADQAIGVVGDTLHKIKPTVDMAVMVTHNPYAMAAKEGVDGAIQGTKVASAMIKETQKRVADVSAQASVALNKVAAWGKNAKEQVDETLMNKN